MGTSETGLRPATPEDAPFLFEVYAATRAEELRAVGWSAEEQDAFLRMQFTAQDRHYREHYPGAEFLIVETEGVAVGRLYLQRTPREIRVMDIALLPGARGQGLGTRLLEDVIVEAERTGRDVSIHVEQHNPARRLYERLGFREVELRGIYVYMVRAPSAAAPANEPRRLS